MVSAVVIVWPIIVIILSGVLTLWDSDNAGRKALALSTLGFIQAGAIFGFPGLTGQSLLQIVWFFPVLTLFMIVAALYLVWVAAWRYRPMGRHWQKAAVAAAIAMTLALTAPVILWLQYALTQGQASAISMGLAGAVALTLFGYLKRRQRKRKAAGYWY